MEIITYKEDWKPSDIQCDWKPSKLGRYSFNLKLQLIRGITEGYKQNSSTPTQDSNYYLTDYIEVIPNGRYYIEKTVSSTLTKNILYLSYFDRDKQYLSTETFSEEWWDFIDISNSSACYVRITFYNVTLGKIILYNKKNVDFDNKKTEVLSIVDNKENIQVYKDLNLEVFVKQEAIIKNFVNCFNLKAFQSYKAPHNFLFHSYDIDYYQEKYNIPKWQKNHSYSVGDKVYIELHTSYNYKDYYVSKSNHTSSSSNFYDDINKWYYITSFPKSEPTLGRENWINAEENIDEDNYSNNSPYIANLVFKNLWKCDQMNYCDTYVRSGYLTICYDAFFSKNLRKKQSDYNKFFNQGYFDDFTNSSYEEDASIRLIFGSFFKNDEILGIDNWNHYFSIEKDIHDIPENWDVNEDSINLNYFGGTLEYPFCNYYKFTPKLGMPFFKEKIFDDSFIRMVLQKEDVLGNIYKRIVDLPIRMTFTNNLIKAYSVPAVTVGDYSYKYYDKEFLNSTNIYTQEISIDSGTSYFWPEILFIWCPDVTKLHLSSNVIVGRGSVLEAPALFAFNGFNISDSPSVNPNPLFTGQFCVLKWKVGKGDLATGDKIKADFKLEYSDGELYDKWIFMEETTIRIE